MLRIRWWFVASSLAALVPGTLAAAQQGTPKPRSAKLLWTMDLSKMKIPDAPVSGTVHGRDFAMDQAKLDGGWLTIRRGKEFWPEAAVVISLFVKEGESVAGKTYRVGGAGARPFNSPHIRIEWAPTPGAMPDTQMFMDKYAMVLEFGKSKGGQLPGKLYICVPDESKSVVAGTFSVEVFDATHPLATNSLISGKVTIKSGPKDIDLDLRCMGMNQEGKLECPSSSLNVAEGTGSADLNHRPRETRLTWDKTRGIGKHEHTNRPPGWYLVSLQGHERKEPEGGGERIWREGYYDWKWVELKDKNSKVVADLVVDPAILGEVEVSALGAPKGAVVTYLPLNAGGRFPWPEAHWYLHGIIGVKVTEGKAAVRWLRAGRYQIALIAEGQGPAPLATAEATVTPGQTTKIELVPAKASTTPPRPATQPSPLRPTM